MSAADHSVPAECRTPPNGGAGPRNPRGIAESALARDVREGELRTFTACACARYAIPTAGELQQRPCCDESLPAVEAFPGMECFGVVDRDYLSLCNDD